ncbi:hypothetical protein FQR65_LT03484 [Abscondita terminalis]|nr:hypothetical protein FQR65_LT03484 [Abscondita terminalis]
MQLDSCELTQLLEQNSWISLLQMDDVVTLTMNEDGTLSELSKQFNSTQATEVSAINADTLTQTTTVNYEGDETVPDNVLEQDKTREKENNFEHKPKQQNMAPMTVLNQTPVAKFYHHDSDAPRTLVKNITETNENNKTSILIDNVNGTTIGDATELNYDENTYEEKDNNVEHIQKHIN